MSAATYGDTLREAMDRAGVSARRLSFLLADETGNKQESERRAIVKYMNNEGAPDPKRAAILAVLLRAPELASVPAAATRRRDRLAALEAQVVAHGAVLEVLSPLVAGLDDRVAALERLAPSESESGDGRA